MPDPLVENAPAKVNLTLRVVGRRADHYHDIESLVVFADIGDRLDFLPGGPLRLTVRGPAAAQAGDDADNLVLKAARALAARVPAVRFGNFQLDKHLPVAAGLGGGSADAAAALRLLARANGIAGSDPRLHEAARATGSDVPVCLDPHPRLMRGIGDMLSQPLPLPRLDAVLVNPGVAVATKAVFAAWQPTGAHPPPADAAAVAALADRDQIFQFLRAQTNDLETSAIVLAPVIADVLAALRVLAGCRLTRMSGSGATCFALFGTAAEARAAAEALQTQYPQWWVRACMLG